MFRFTEKDKSGEYWTEELNREVFGNINNFLSCLFLTVNSKEFLTKRANLSVGEVCRHREVDVLVFGQRVSQGFTKYVAIKSTNTTNVYAG